MELVLISPEGDDPREREVLPRLFAAGLRRYHVRKPAWPAGLLREWLLAFPPEQIRSMVLHSHHELAEELGLAGRHWRDEGSGPDGERPAGPFTSRSCHDLPALEDWAGRVDSVLFGPVFPSISKPGRTPSAGLERGALAGFLRGRSAERRRTAVLALGGITAPRVPECRRLGFDGVAALGAVWLADDPAAAFEALRSACAEPRPLPRLLCLTQDGLAMTHEEQARRLCAAGARWIQVRMKRGPDDERRRVARACARICREAGALCVINDRVDLALEAEADGVHLGREDGDWREARARLGPRAILGGTVNDEEDARRAVASGCLDYVGLGPLRFTSTKRKLSPILGLEGIARLLPRLGGLPAWAIGGVTAADVAPLLAAGAAGVAVSSALYAGGRIEDNLGRFPGADDRVVPIASPAPELSPSAEAAREICAEAPIL